MSDSHTDDRSDHETHRFPTAEDADDAARYRRLLARAEDRVPEQDPAETLEQGIILVGLVENADDLIEYGLGGEEP